MKLKSLLKTTTPLSLGILLCLSPLAATSAKQIEELDRIIAVVNEDVITRSELMRRMYLLKLKLREDKVKLPPESVFRKQVLEHMVLENIMIQMAERRGIRVSDEAVNRYISAIAQSKKLTLNQFRQVLKKDGISFAEFRQTQKDQMIMERLKHQFQESEVKITRQEVEHHLAKIKKGEQTEYRLAHIMVGIPEAASPEQIEKAEQKAKKIHQQLKNGADFSQVAIASSDGQQALKGGKLGWLTAAQLPGLFTNEIEKMKPGTITSPIRSPSGFHILKLENKRNKGSRQIVNQTLARHILIKTSPAMTDQQAREKLQKLRRQILAGADFARLAKVHSMDGSAQDGGNLGWTSPGSFVPAFEQEMDKLKKGETSPVFQSPFGWHIVQVVSRRKHDDTDRQQEMQVKQMIYKRKASEAVENWMRRLRDEAYVQYMLDN